MLLPARHTSPARSSAIALYSLAASSCRAETIPTVACAEDADCGIGLACVELGCRPAPIIVNGRASADTLPMATLLDDFERLDRLPNDARFGPWVASLYDSDDCKDGRTGSATSQLTSGHMALQWLVADIRDGKDCFPAVGVTTTPLLGVIDLTVYDRVRFALAHEPTDPACVPAAQASIALRCDPALYSFVFPTPSDWQTYTVSWENFVAPDWVDDDSVALPECLSRVQNITVGPIPNLLDGQCQAGTLRIDGVWLGARPAE